MQVFHRRNFTAAAIAWGLLALVPTAGAETPDDATLARALRAGGHVILIRHGATFNDQADTDPLNFDNIAAQRQLNDKGKALAQGVRRSAARGRRSDRQGLHQQATPRLRDRDAGRLQGRREDAGSDRRRPVISPDEEGRRAEALRAMLAAPPKPGTNTLLVTHKPNLLEALGKDWWDVKEGEASIFRPENGKYVLVARVQMADWPRIAKAAAH